MVRDSNDILRTRQANISQAFEQHLESIFKSTNPSIEIVEAGLDDLRCKVTKDMNQELDKG